MTNALVLYEYWRSSAAYRVRIALNLKGLEYASQPVHLVRDGGEQHAPEYRQLNPQGQVPCLLDGDRAITQSLAIIEYLDELHPQPGLLPMDARGRQQVRTLAMMIACDIHPVGNLRVLQRLGTQFDATDAQRAEWSRHWIASGFDAFEAVLGHSAATGRYCHGDRVTMADLCLVPQVYNARRWKVPMDAYPTINRIDQACRELEAFQRAAPEAQNDAPSS